MNKKGKIELSAPVEIILWIVFLILAGAVVWLVVKRLTS
jgi:hypothetical protein